MGGKEQHRDLLGRDIPELRDLLRAEPDPEADRARAIRAELVRRDRAGARFMWFEGDIQITERPGDEEREGDDGRRPS